MRGSCCLHPSYWTRPLWVSCRMDLEGLFDTLKCEAIPHDMCFRGYHGFLRLQRSTNPHGQNFLQLHYALQLAYLGWQGPSLELWAWVACLSVLWTPLLRWLGPATHQESNYWSAEGQSFDFWAITKCSWDRRLILGVFLRSDLSALLHFHQAVESSILTGWKACFQS